MQQICTLHAGKIHAFDDAFIKSVSISTDLWENKHRFEDHWTNRLPSDKIENVHEWIENNFPEVNKVCESLKATSQKA
jgi:hypothetical protein